jgi:hypothetical protein
MIQHNLVDMAQLQRFVEDVVPRAQEFDLTPSQMRNNLGTIRQMLKA